MKKNINFRILVGTLIVVIFLSLVIFVNFFDSNKEDIVLATKDIATEDTATIESVRQKLEYICPFYAISGIYYRECLYSVAAEMEKRFNGSETELEKIKDYCYGVIYPYRDALYGRELYSSCIAYKLNLEKDISYPKVMASKTPIEIGLVGKIFATMQSGNSYAIRVTEGVANPIEVGIYYPDKNTMTQLSGNVQVDGKITHYDCEAYQGIFKGCVPWVEIEDIWSIKK